MTRLGKFIERNNFHNAIAFTKYTPEKVIVRYLYDRRKTFIGILI